MNPFKLEADLQKYMAWAAMLIWYTQLLDGFYLSYS